METTFPQAYSRNAAEAWSIKDGHLHSTLTAFIRLGQQQERWNIGISNSHSPRLKRKEQNFASKSVLECKLLKLWLFIITQDTSTHTNQMPSSWFSMETTPETLCLWALFLYLLLLGHPSLACSDLDQLSSPWWPTRYAILPCRSGSPFWILLLLLFSLLCALWFSPVSCLARHLVLILPGPGLCCRSFLPSVVI